MKKLRYIFVTLLLLCFLSGNATSVLAQTIPGQLTTPEGSGSGTVTQNIEKAAREIQANSVEPEQSCWFDPLCWVTKIAGSVLLKVTGLLAQLGGVALNAATYYTVVMMSTYYNGLTVIAETWEVVRDVANMAFIFVLLWISIQMILGTGRNPRELIVKVIIAAILINFSLFFTRVIIDAANLLALTFYTAITGESNLETLKQFSNFGLSNAFTDILNLQTLWKSNLVSNTQIITIGILGSALLLIAAFVFFAVAIMLIIRYVVLILIMILSPLMFVANILPNLESYRKQWMDALLGQAFFAPVYFFMAWISVRVAQGIKRELMGSTNISWSETLTGTVSIQNGQYVTNYESGTINLILLFAIVIIFMVASLIIAKKQAEKAGPYASKLTGWATGAAFGAAGWAGRTSIGRGAALLGGSKYGAQLTAAASGPQAKTGIAGAGARLALYAQKKAASGTFDLRRATVPTGAVSDLVRGTAGRTEIGKKLGLHEYEVIKSIPVGEKVAAATGIEAADDKGFKELRAEKSKRWEGIRATESTEARLAQAQLDVMAGAKSGASPAEIDDMEKALSKLTDKEVETLVSSNKDLLQSQNFANRISVQQLEALNKSEKFNETEKTQLKDNRFRNIRTGIDALSVAPARRTPEQAAAVNALGGNIKALSDKELDMLDDAILTDKNFVTELRSGQMESINKSSKITRTQRDKVKNVRKEPFLEAINANDAPEVGRQLRKLGKELSSADTAALIDPLVIPHYTPQILKRMVSELSPDKIAAIRNAVTAASNNAVFNWLNSPNGINEFS